MLDFQQAVALQVGGDLKSAAAALEDLLRVSPHDARVPVQLMLVRLQQDRLDEVVALGNAAIANEPSNAGAYAWMGEAKRRKGDLTEAIGSMERAVELRHDLAPAWFNLGLAYVAAGRPADAQRAWETFLRLRPADRRVRRELGLLDFDARDYPSALRWFHEQLALDEQSVTSRCDVASTYLRMRQWHLAEEALNGLSQPAQGSFRALLLRGQALVGQLRHAEAVTFLARAHALAPEDIDAAYELGLAHDRLANLVSAIRCFDVALKLAPERADIAMALGVAELNLGDVDSAIAHHRAAVKLDPNSPALHSALLMALHYGDITPTAMFDEHLAWALRHAAMAPLDSSSFCNVRDPARRLRIGYLSPRFGRGPLAHFFLPVLRAHDPEQVEIFGYMVSEHRDSATEEMSTLSDTWRHVPHLADAELAQLIRADQIDILVDMAGHCPGNRLGVFTRRAAPIQISWLDYDDTTAVPAMDYYLSDAVLTPSDGAQLFTENILRVAPVRAPHSQSTLTPDPGPLPQLRNRYTTFGCINRISKIGPRVTETWARILRRVPQSHLLLQAAAFASGEPRRVVRERFAGYGIAPDRLDLRPFSDEAKMLLAYRDIDICLDPFPYNGCNTTCDALSMGVPVVTLEGQSLTGRHGVAILSSCDLGDWVATSVDSYVDLACAKAGDPHSLEALRAQLPRRFQSAPISDAVVFTAGLESEFKRLWSEWCALHAI